MKFKTIQTAPVSGIGEINLSKSEVDDTCIFRDITTLIPQLVRYQDYADDYYYESVGDSDDGDYDDFDDDLTTIDEIQNLKERRFENNTSQAVPEKKETPEKVENQKTDTNEQQP